MTGEADSPKWRQNLKNQNYMFKNFKRVATLVAAVVLSLNAMAQFNVSVGYIRNYTQKWSESIQKIGLA